eukprot:3083696-Rhodomonas_salina.2
MDGWREGGMEGERERGREGAEVAGRDTRGTSARSTLTDLARDRRFQVASGNPGLDRALRVRVAIRSHHRVPHDPFREGAQELCRHVPRVQCRGHRQCCPGRHSTRFVLLRPFYQAAHAPGGSARKEAVVVFGESSGRDYEGFFALVVGYARISTSYSIGKCELLYG